MFREKPCVCVPLLSNANKHFSESSVIGMYFAFQDGTDTYINFTHPDELKSTVDLNDIVLTENSLVFNKKALMYHGFDGGIDLNSYLHYYTGDSINSKEFYPKVMEILLNRFFKIQELGHIVPLANQLDYARRISEYVLIAKPFSNNQIISKECIDYCNDFTNIFYQIEKSDIIVGEEIKKQNYMWYTSTSRPSNTWDTFNFSALNKKDGSRNKIRSRFDGGKIVQFDYDAFHIKLLAKILEHEFDYHPYEQLRNELNLSMDYDTFKSKIFQNIYGGITDDFIQHPFMKKIQALIDELWCGYKKSNRVQSLFYGKLFRDIQGATPNKVFNYVLQSLETEYNVKKIKTILPLLNDKQSVFMMYLYDAFVFDIHPSEMKLIDDLTKALQTDNMSIKIYVGDTFGDIKRI